MNPHETAAPGTLPLVTRGLGRRPDDSAGRVGCVGVGLMSRIGVE